MHQGHASGGLHADRDREYARARSTQNGPASHCCRYHAQANGTHQAPDGGPRAAAAGVGQPPRTRPNDKRESDREPEATRELGVQGVQDEIVARPRCLTRDVARPNAPRSMCDCHPRREPNLAASHRTDREIAVFSVGVSEQVRAKAPDSLQHTAPIRNVARQVVFGTHLKRVLIQRIPRDRPDRSRDGYCGWMAVEVVDRRRNPGGRRNRVVIGE